jgi:GNAT superfamily N-acetyltransferase
MSPPAEPEKPMISRLGPEHAALIVDCFRRVYGESYANELFYDVEGLAGALSDGRIGSVGALTESGTLLAHMAMTVLPRASVVELGNTVVDPSARGGGLAWQVGAELSAWCRALGYPGFLHYPTTDHHIMQRQSVRDGFETGLMLGYIPAETRAMGAERQRSGRQAATIVYEPYTIAAPMSGFLPDAYADVIRQLAAPTGLVRSWRRSRETARAATDVDVVTMEKRGLHRARIARVGADVTTVLGDFAARNVPCLQVDLALADPAVGIGVDAAIAAGFRFCGWLPGYRDGDVLRLQRVDERVTHMVPELENPVARSLLQLYWEKGL